jgi:hypothetical protein
MYKDIKDRTGAGSEGVHSTELAHDKALYKHADKYVSSVKAWDSLF